MVNNLIYNPGHARRSLQPHRRRVARPAVPDWPAARRSATRCAEARRRRRICRSSTARAARAISEYYEADNIAVDWTGQELPKSGRYTHLIGEAHSDGEAGAAVRAFGPSRRCGGADAVIR